MFNKTKVLVGINKTGRSPTERNADPCGFGRPPPDRQDQESREHEGRVPF